MRATYVHPEGQPQHCSWAIFGEQPGKTDIMRGKPFIGAAGQELNNCLNDAGLNRQNGYLSNVIKDYDAPLDRYITFNRASAPSVSADCQTYLNELEMEIRSLGPSCRCIIACGNLALWALTGRTGVTKWRGSILPCLYHPTIPVIPIIHPATMLPPKSVYLNKHLITNDLKRVAKLLSADYQPTQRNIKINPSFAEARTYLENLLVLAKQNHPVLAYDIEIHNEQVSCISFSTSAVDAISIPFICSQGDCYSIDQETTLWELIATILENPRLPKIGQNISFDSHFLLRRYGIRAHNLNDTMVAQQILMGDYPKGLDFITSIWTDHPYYKDEGKRWFKVGGPWEQLWQYNATDSIICAEAFPKQMDALIQQRNVATYERQRMLIEPLVYMQEHGIRTDMEGIRKKGEMLLMEAAEIQQKLNAVAGQTLNPNSPKQLKEYFYITKGYKPYVKRGGGGITVDKLALKRLSRKGCEEAKLILEMRRRTKLASTYLNLDKIDSDGRMRCSYNPVGTRYSRLSSSSSIFGTGMNMQNIPHEILQYFLPDEGYVYYAYDLSQAENRIVAYVGNIPEMIDAFESGKDVHRLTSALIFKKPYDAISDEENSSPFGDGKSERDWGKRANHGLNYDLGYRSFALYYEMPESDAKFIVEAYHRAYPGVRNNYHTHVRQSLRENRTVTNLMGRRTLFLEAWGDDLFKEAYACIPQGTTGDVINERGMNYIYYNQRQFAPVEMLVQVHDSIGFQIPLSCSWLEHARMLQAIKDSLETPLTTHFGRQFVIPADLQMGLTLNKRSGCELKHGKWPGTVEQLATQLEQNYAKLSQG